MKAMGRAFEAITAMGILGVLMAIGAMFAFGAMLINLAEKLPVFQTDADKARIAVDAAATKHAAAVASPWTPWVVGAERLLLISLCLAVTVLVLGGAVAFVWRRVMDAQVVWPRAGIYPVPRSALSQQDGAPLLGVHTADEFWRTEEANARRQLPPVRQDVHITGGRDEAKEALEAHHEAPSFSVLSKDGQYGEADAK